MKSIFVTAPTLLISIALMGISFNTNASSFDLAFTDTFDYGDGASAYYYAGVGDSISDDAGSYLGYARAESQWGTTREREFVSAQAQSQFTFLGYNSSATASMYGVADTSLIFNIKAIPIDGTLDVPAEVPLFLDWSIFAKSTTVHENAGGRPDATSIAEVYFTTGADIRHHRVITGDGAVSDSGLDMMMMQGGQVQVSLSASVDTRVSSSDYGSDLTVNSAWGYAYADPVISIDPDWEFADQYTLNYTLPEFALESASVSTVPIPAAAWLFGSGLLGLIGLARQKKS